MIKGYKIKFIKNGQEYVYSLSYDDIMDLFRATYREGPNYSAVVWSLINRFAYYYPNGKYKTLSGLIRAYAQPINPDWFPNGKAFLNYIKNIPSDQLEREYNNALKRVEYSKLSEEKIPSKIKELVINILDGNIENPVPGSVHYIASHAPVKGTLEQAKDSLSKFLKVRTDLSKSIIPLSSPNSILSGYNWFFASPGTENFKVNIQSGDDSKEYLTNVGVIDAPGTAIMFILAGATAYKLADILKKEVNLNKFLSWIDKYDSET